MKKLNWKLIISMFGLGCMIGFSIILFITILLGYLDPAKEIIVAVDVYGEGLLELILVPICILCGVYSFRCMFKEMTK